MQRSGDGNGTVDAGPRGPFAGGRASIAAYALALALAALAAALQWALHPWVPARGIFVLFPPMMVIAAMRGGAGPGLVVWALGLLSGAMGAAPVGSVWVAERRDQLMLAAFAVTGLALVAYVAHARRTSLRARQAEERLRLAQENTGIGLFELDFEHNTAYATPSLCDLVGRPRMNDSMELSDWLQSLPAGNVEETLRVLDTQRLEGRYSYEREQCFALPDGRTRWLLSRVRVDTDAGGRMLRARGATIDISERKQLDLQLQRTRAELEQQVDDLRQLHELSTRLLEHAQLEPQLQAILAVLVVFHGAESGVLSVVGAEVQAAVQVHCGLGQTAEAAGAVGHSTPLVGLSGEVLGVATVYLPAPRAPSEREQRLADICARKAAVFVERAQAQARAELHRQALQEADRRKDEFLATLAHELRNPLAPIRQAALMAGSAAEEAQRRWSHAVIERQVQHMSMLLDDLLDVSRITRGTLQLRTGPVTLAAVVEAALETARPAIDARGHVLSVMLPDAPVLLQADALRLAQVLSNVLINAAKYTDAGGRIALTATLTSAMPPEPTESSLVRIEVADNGIGIRPEALTEVFRMFTQARALNDRGAPAQGGMEPDRAAGLGIGLALAKGLVEMHGGRIMAHSDGPGLGTCVTIELPVGVPVDVPVDVPVGRPDTTAGNDDGSVSERATAPLAVGAPHGRRVLIADDNRDAADTLGLVLAHFGHQVEVVYDGQAAWDAWRRGGHDVAVLDLGMPGLRGEVVASEIRRTAGDDAALLIALTGWGQDSDKRRASLAGFDHHLTKPVDPQQLQRLITRPTSALAGPGVVAR